MVDVFDMQTILLCELVGVIHPAYVQIRGETHFV